MADNTDEKEATAFCNLRHFSCGISRD